MATHSYSLHEKMGASIKILEKWLCLFIIPSTTHNSELLEIQGKMIDLTSSSKLRMSIHGLSPVRQSDKCVSQGS